VPSFSSKGFPTRRDGRSEVAEIIEGASEWLVSNYLVSAYDLHHQLIGDPSSLGAFPELLIVDSGGYETRIEHSLSADRHVPHQPLAWSQEHYTQRIHGWPKHVPAAFVSYDSPTVRVPLQEQVNSARELLAPVRNYHLRILLVKPTTTEQDFLRTALKDLVDDPSLVSDFDVLGVTEEELGKSPLERMEQLALLRLAFLDANLQVPVHVFGALDPVSALLYYCCGATVFDGLSWLRYGFDGSGWALSRRSYSAKNIDHEVSDAHGHARMIRENIFFLERMRTAMRKFALDFQFETLGGAGGTVREAVRALRTRQKLKGRL